MRVWDSMSDIVSRSNWSVNLTKTNTCCTKKLWYFDDNDLNASSFLPLVVVNYWSQLSCVKFLSSTSLRKHGLDIHSSVPLNWESDAKCIGFSVKASLFEQYTSALNFLGKLWHIPQTCTSLVGNREHSGSLQAPILSQSVGQLFSRPPTLPPPPILIVNIWLSNLFFKVFFQGNELAHTLACRMCWSFKRAFWSVFLKETRPSEMKVSP